MLYRSYRLITVTVAVFEKVSVTIAITVTVSLRDYKVAYASFQAGRRPARKLVFLNLIETERTIQKRIKSHGVPWSLHVRRGGG